MRAIFLLGIRHPTSIAFHFYRLLQIPTDQQHHHPSTFTHINPTATMKLAILTTTLAAALTASATPLLPRATEMCGDWDNVAVQDYTLYNNLWGKGSATSGSQCTTLDGSSGSTIKWHSAWSWAGGQYNVKSYPNVVVKSQNVALSKIKSIPSTWSWSYTGTGLVTNVAYDLFTSDTAGGAEKFELMVWLANINAGPISR